METIDNLYVEFNFNAYFKKFGTGIYHFHNGKEIILLMDKKYFLLKLV
jgi:hypothetical protein